MFTIFPELVRCARAYDEERLALLAHHYFGNGQAPKLRAHFEEMLSKAGIILCYETSLDTHGALIIKEEKGLISPIFCVRKDLDWMEQKFLIANLLGRLLLEHQVKILGGHSRAPNTREVHSPYQRFLASRRPRFSQFSRQVTRMEWLADEFAGAFILPKQWLRKFVEEEKDPIRIAAHFSVSLDFLHARIKHIRQKYQIAVHASKRNPLSRVRDHIRKVDP